VGAHARLLLLWSLSDELMTSNTSAVRGLLSEHLIALDCPLVQHPFSFLPFGSALGELASKADNNLLRSVNVLSSIGLTCERVRIVSST